MLLSQKAPPFSSPQPFTLPDTLCLCFPSPCTPPVCALLLLLQVVALQPLLEGGGVPPDTAAWLINTAGLTLELSVMVAGG